RRGHQVSRPRRLPQSSGRQSGSLCALIAQRITVAPVILPDRPAGHQQTRAIRKTREDWFAPHNGVPGERLESDGNLVTKLQQRFWIHRRTLYSEWDSASSTLVSSACRPLTCKGCELRRAKMRKVVSLMGAVLGLAIVQSASAADLPTKAPLMAPAAPVSWTGFYVGVHAGAGWSHIESSFPGSGFVFSSHDLTGAFAGAQVGYNWQMG